MTRAPAFSWVATEAKTGRILADLPRFDVPSTKKSLGRYEPASGTLPLIGAPEDWDRIMTPGATVFWLLRDNPDDPAHGIPAWGGMLIDDPRTHADSLKFAMQSIEWYFDQRFVGDDEYVNVGQNLIVKDLVENHIAVGPNGGLPIRVQIVNGGDGKLRTRTDWKNKDDKTIYSVLRDLMGVIDGPEWTVGGEWQANPERITPVLYVGDRIGTAVTTGLSAAAVFEMPGPVREFQRYRSYANGKGANAVMATSSGQGDERPESGLVVTPDLLRPTFEHRFTPSTSIKEIDTLNAHAEGKAATLKDGTVTLELSAIADKAPQLDVDWFIGDDIGYQITAPAFPNGISGTARAVGWELKPQGTAIITPILAGGDLT
ncbi:hypothetical protein [Agromyces ramosus]|uniref:Minor tail protein n=1 Tax=Agromyces ramosus TaxID=33879 RepID=A0ABU0R8L9_9MICO|nr:hypothetical protein [Agromyces ramosus]MDQ0894418.1 hypothetical protein [Agromyces ramosus]